MADPADDDFSRVPIESLARFLAVCGREDPSLLRRARRATGRLAGWIASPRDVADRSRSLLPSPAGVPDGNSYLEELVSMALASARRAEDAARQASASIANTRRRVATLAVFGTVMTVATSIAVDRIAIGSNIVPTPTARDVRASAADRSTEPPPAPDIEPSAAVSAPAAPASAAPTSGALASAASERPLQSAIAGEPDAAAPVQAAAAAPIADVPVDATPAPDAPKAAIFVPPLPLPPNATEIPPASPLTPAPAATAPMRLTPSPRRPVTSSHRSPAIALHDSLREFVQRAAALPREVRALLHQ